MFYIEVITALEQPADGVPVRRFGDYELVHEIARGGMGVVYRARQVSLNRLVALKIMRDAQLASPTRVRRFRIEAEAAAQLEHPNIVPIYEFGECDGHLFISMKLVPGADLAAALHGIPMDPERAARLMRTVARAVHHAHQRRVLHRDLKPANVLLAESDEPYVTDFGVAKIEDRGPGITMTEEIVGSPNYMAPEQAEARHDEVTTVSDVYSLGAILYELLTGRAPFRASTPLETMRKVLEEEPTRPRSLYRFADPELETICLKCMEKEPRRRYGSAEALADDLERWLRKEPILARRTTTVERVWKWMRRNPKVATLVVLLHLVFITGLTAVLILGSRVAKEARQSHDRLVRMYIAAGNHAVQDGDQFAGLLWFAEVLKLEQGNPLNEDNHRCRIEAALRESPILAHSFFCEGPVDCLAFSPDGNRLLTGGSDRKARLWDCNRGDLVFPPLEHAAAVRRVSFSPDGSRLLTMTTNGEARVWDASTGLPVTGVLRHEDFDAAAIETRAIRLAPCASFSPDGSRILTAGRSKAAYVWDAGTGQLLYRLSHPGVVHHAAFSRDGKWIVTSGNDKLARVWDASSAQLAGPALPHDQFVAWSEFSPDGHRLLTVSDRRNVRVWDWASGRQIGETISHGHVLFSAGFSPDGRKVLTASWDMTARLWDAATGQTLSRFEHNGGLLDAAFSPDGKWFATACNDGTSRVWDIAQSSRATAALPEGAALNTVRFSPDGQFLAAASDSGQVRVWKLSSPGAVAQSFAHPEAIWAEFSPDARLVVTAGAWQTRDARIWDAQNATRIGAALQHHGAVHVANFSPDGKRLVTGSDDCHARIWEVSTSRELMPSLLHPSTVRQAIFSPDGRFVLTTCGDSAARIWDTGSAGGSTAQLRHSNEVTRAAWSPDGTLVATASSDHTAQLWLAPSGRPASPPLAHETEVTYVAFSPDGKRLATGCRFSRNTGGSVSIWDVSEAKRLGPPLKQGGSVLMLEFSRDGRRLVVTSSESERFVRIWDSHTFAPVTANLPLDDSVLEARFSPDGRRLATLTASGVFRLWDSSTGDPVSPPLPLRRKYDLGHLCFSPDGSSVLVATGADAAQVLSFPNTQDSIDHLVLETQMLSARYIDSTGAMAPLDAIALSNAWVRVRATAPWKTSE